MGTHPSRFLFLASPVSSSHVIDPAPPPVPAAHSALDQALDSSLNAVPPVPCLPLLLRLGVDQRNSSFKSTTSALKAFVNSLHVLVCFS